MLGEKWGEQHRASGALHEFVKSVPFKTPLWRYTKIYFFNKAQTRNVHGSRKDFQHSATTFTVTEVTASQDAETNILPPKSGGIYLLDEKDGWRGLKIIFKDPLVNNEPWKVT